MPGAIEVSVLDLGLPSSKSSSSSSFSVKVSMGKREYQTWDRGDLSFPLTNLHDNLIITLLDAEGNELTRTGVETMTVVEKGIWDDMFPLEGGGHLHMKLQFILNEEERKRIREMRESAVKKKHGELLNSSLKHLETPVTPDAAVGADVVSPSLCLKHEVADTQEKPAEIKAVNITEGSIQGVLVSNPVSCSNYPQSGPENREGTPLDLLEKIAPDSSDVTPSSTPLSKDLDALHLTKAIHKNLDMKVEIHPPPTDVPVMPITLLEAIDPQLGCSESFITENKHCVSAIMGTDQTRTTEKERALEKIPSNVRNLISAFESSLAQEPRAHADPAMMKSQSSKTEVEHSLNSTFEKEDNTEKTKSIQQISGKRANSFSREKFWDVKSQQNPKYSRKQEYIGLDAYGPAGKIVPQNTGQLVVLSAGNTPAEQTSSSGGVKLKIVGKLENRNEDIKSPKDFTGPSIIETATVSGRMLDGCFTTEAPCTLCSDQEASALGVVLDENEWGTSRENSGKLNICENSNRKQKSVTYSEVEHYPFDSPGNWIFPDEARSLCITTGGKQVMNLLGSCHVCRETYQRKLSLSRKEAVNEHNMRGNTDTEVNEDDITYHNLRKSKVESAADVKISGGLIAQAVKIAIMVAFGTLVLVTRQRKSR